MIVQATHSHNNKAKLFKANYARKERERECLGRSMPKKSVAFIVNNLIAFMGKLMFNLRAPNLSTNNISNPFC